MGSLTQFFYKLKLLIKSKRDEIALKKDLKEIENLNLFIKTKEIANRAINQLKKQQKSKTLESAKFSLFIESIFNRLNNGSLSNQIRRNINININILNFSLVESHSSHQIFIDEFKINFYIVDVSRILLANFLILIIGVILWTQIARFVIDFGAKPITNPRDYQIKKSCGDISVGGVNIWYPVYADYSKLDLEVIRNKFCCNAEYDPDFGIIQIASFHSIENANKFVLFLRNKGFKSARIGIGEEINTISSEKQKSTCKEK